MRAAIYQRLSASRLGEEAPGLDRQREACERAVRERGWELVGDYHDADTSAFRPGVPRPGWEELTAAVVARDVDAVVVWKLDRAFRRLKEGVDFLDVCQENDVAVVSVTEGIDTATPFGPVLFALFASMAALESQTKSDRITEWHAQRAAEGQPSGGGTRAFGYTQDGLRLNRREANAIRKAARDLLAGSNLARSIRAWNGKGITTPTGGRWTKSSFRRMILSARIAGLREHGGSTYSATWPEIITQDEHTRLRALYSAPGRAIARRYVLAGLARCGLCGAKLVARPKADGRRCYVCATDHGGCGKIRTLAAPVEELVAREVDRHYAEQPPEKGGDRADRQASLRAQLDADEQALDELARDRYVHRTITPAEFVAAREPLVQRIADVQEALRAATDSPQTWAEFFANPGLEAPWELPPGTDPEPDDFAYWRRWVGEVVEAVTIGPAVKGRNFFDPSRLTIAWRGTSTTP